MGKKIKNFTEYFVQTDFRLIKQLTSKSSPLHKEETWLINEEGMV